MYFAWFFAFATTNYEKINFVSRSFEVTFSQTFSDSKEKKHFLLQDLRSMNAFFESE